MVVSEVMAISVGSSGKVVVRQIQCQWVWHYYMQAMFLEIKFALLRDSKVIFLRSGYDMGGGVTSIVDAMVAKVTTSQTAFRPGSSLGDPSRLHALRSIATLSLIDTPRWHGRSMFTKMVQKQCVVQRALCSLSAALSTLSAHLLLASE